MLVSIANAKQGMALDGDLFGDNNEKILASGTLLTDAIISLLKSEGFDSVNLSISEDEQKKWGLNENFINPTVNKKILDDARNLLTKLITPEGYQNLNKESIQEITHIAELISAKILATNSTLSYDINDYVNNKDLISQSIRVSIYATALAKQYNNTLASSNMTSRINLEEIATAGLLSNYGSICSNEDVRRNLDYYIPIRDDFPGLTEDKIIQLKVNYNPEYISYYSYNLLRECEPLSSFVKTAITLSSENDKMTGPLQARQFNGELTNKSATVIAAKMLSLSKKFDEILSKNVNKTGNLSTAETALKELFTSEEYNKELTTLFMNTIPLYPIGTKVELKGIHNGAGVVVDNHSDIDTWHRPTVKCLDTDEEVDLRIENTTQISNILGHDIEVTDKKENVEEKVEAPAVPTENNEVKEEAPVPVSVPEEPKVEEPAQEVAPVTESPATPAPTPVAEEAAPTIETPAAPTENTEVKEEVPTPVSVPEEPKVEEPAQEVAPVTESPAIPAPTPVAEEAAPTIETPAAPTENTEVKEEVPTPVSVPEEPKVEEPAQEVAPVTESPATPAPTPVAEEAAPTVEAPVSPTENPEAKEEAPVPVSVPEEPKVETPAPEATSVAETESESVAEPNVVSPEATQTANIAEEPIKIEPTSTTETPVAPTENTEVKEETPVPVSVPEEPKVEEPAQEVAPVTETPATPAPTPVAEEPAQEVAPVIESPATPAPTPVVDEQAPVAEPTKVIEDIIPSEPIDPIGQNNQPVTEQAPISENPSSVAPSAAEEPIELVSGPSNIFGNNNYQQEESVGMRR